MKRLAIIFLAIIVVAAVVAKVVQKPEEVEEAPEPPTRPLVVAQASEPDPDPEIEPYPYWDIEMLACIIYQEAGGDAACDECRMRVADVVLNRVEDERFPDSILKVLTQEGQYCMEDGIKWPERRSLPIEAHAVERAYETAERVVFGEHSDIYGKGYIWQAAFVQGVDNIECCGIIFGR